MVFNFVKKNSHRPKIHSFQACSFNLMLSFLFYFATLSLISSCGEPVYSPWQVNLPSDARELTAKNIARLPKREIGDSFRIGLLSDPQGTPEELRVVVDMMNARDDLDFIVVLGDLTNDGRREEFLWAQKILDSSRVPWLTVIGNHDGLANGKLIYRDLLGPFDYVFEHGGVRFLMWNNNHLEFPGEAPNWDWLSSHAKPGAVVMAHMPPIAEDVFSETEVVSWKERLEDLGVSASVHGHRHAFSYWREEVGEFEMEQALTRTKPITNLNDKNGIHFFVAARVLRREYGIMTIPQLPTGVTPGSSFFRNKITFERCSPVCEGVKP